jgi:hypothetical protein
MLFLSFLDLGPCTFATVEIVGLLCLCTLASSTQFNLLRASVHPDLSKLTRLRPRRLRCRLQLQPYPSPSLRVLVLHSECTLRTVLYADPV